MQIKSNAIVKIIVPTVVMIGLFVGLKSCKQQAPTNSAVEEMTTALKSLSPDELKSLGVEGDTPADTLRTLIGSLKDVRDRQKALDKRNAELMKENKQLLRTQDGTAYQETVDSIRRQYEERHQQLLSEQAKLMSSVEALSTKLNQVNENKTQSGSNIQRAQNTQTTGTTGGSLGDIPLGFGFDNLGKSLPGQRTSLESTSNDGLIWVLPSDQQASDPRDASGKALPLFPTSFLDNNPLTRQKAAYEQQVKGYSNEKGAQVTTTPVYTVPENATLVGSRAMTALLGRVPINGTVTDPYPFKILIGKDNLTANGIELPEVEGAIVSGSASGDWVLSCVRGQVNSITFVFADGTLRTVPQPDANGNNTGNGNSQNKTGTDGGIGWISDNDGIPCISGTRKTNAGTYLPSLFALSAAAAAGEAISEGQYTTQNNVNGITSTLTGSAGQAALGKALSGGMSETTDWLKQRYGQTFDAIYVPPGATVAVHITRQLAIDYDTQGRKVHHDFTLPGGIAQHGGLD
ncbi:TIGR03752 family integrating conjugative element protein [Serratia microhaemolytica]|uniref:TIGR03752 family integrating conjugative element protein n=1 Tax=Serratia microhaemolytica TaxID=2675110 RepID=UPI000FDDF821|nr:TIGR03752 family integrating conjugative element protein [Serratia microhaemolytica]